MGYRRGLAWLMALCLWMGTPMATRAEGQAESPAALEVAEAYSLATEAKPDVPVSAEDKGEVSARAAETKQEVTPMPEKAEAKVEATPVPEKTDVKAEMTPVPEMEAGKETSTPILENTDETSEATMVPENPGAQAENTLVPEKTGETLESTPAPEMSSAPEVTPALKMETLFPSVTPTTFNDGHLDFSGEASEMPMPTDDAVGIGTDESEALEISRAPSTDVQLQVKADRAYAFVNGDRVKVQAEISGGTAPYQVSFKAKGAVEVEKSVTADEPGSVSFACMPEKFGTLSITVRVSDVQGHGTTRKIEVAAPIRIKESAFQWEKDFESLVMTGDWREDMIAIAVSQLGYEESQQNFIIDADGTRRGYTRYGDWYAPSADYHDWCAMFVCFCMHYAGIETSDYPRNNISQKWKNRLDDREAFERDGDYQPSRGDLIFFDWDEDGDMDHIGIVEAADEKCVYTIEGNAGKKVARRQYDLKDRTIAGYGNTMRLMEQADIKVDAVKEKPQVSIGPDGVGHTCGTMVNIRKEPSATSQWLACIPEKNTEVKVVNQAFFAGQIWYRVQYDGHEGYVLGTFLKIENP